jgi:hypothetical protein
MSQEVDHFESRYDLRERVAANNAPAVEAHGEAVVATGRCFSPGTPIVARLRTHTAW